MRNAGWQTVQDVDGRFGSYPQVTVGPGGVVALHSVCLAHPHDPADPASQREITLLRRRALTASASLRDEIEQATGRSAWVQTAIVVWSDFPAGCVQDGRCVFLSGPRLSDWLRRRPGQLAPERAGEIVAALGDLAGRGM
jgi:hypothetical protein